MTKVTIKHNPYTVLTDVMIDGHELAENSPFQQRLNERFQLWVDDIPNMLFAEANDSDYTIEFHGTTLDFQDLEIAAENDPEKRYHLVHKEAKPFGEKEQDLRNLFEKIQKLPFKSLQSEELRIKFENSFNDKLEINVVATMSAGKSTLLNALLGQDLLPSEKSACTARITRIEDNGEKPFSAVAYSKLTGEVAERVAELDYETMKRLNSNDGIGTIEVFGDIPFVPTEEVKLVLVDSPGVDNSRDLEHRKTTVRNLKSSSKDLVLFIMNGEHMHNEAENSFLEDIAEMMSKDGKQSKERFLFVVSKLDDYDENKDSIAGRTLPDVVEYLEEKGIKNPYIFPTGALPTLAIRQYTSATNDEDKKKFKKAANRGAEDLIDSTQLHLEQYLFSQPNLEEEAISSLNKLQYQRLSRTCEHIISNELKNAVEDDDDFAQALVHSGIRGLEETIKLYVTKYKRPAKISTIVATFKDYLKEADAITQLETEVTSATNAREELHAKISLLEEKLSSATANNEFREVIQKLEVSSELPNKLQKEASKIEKTLNRIPGNYAKELSPDEAKKLARKIFKEAEKLMQDFSVTVELALDEDIAQKGEQLLAEYIENLKAISDEFSGGGLQLDLESLVSGALDSLKVTGNANAVVDETMETKIEVHTETYKETRIEQEERSREKRVRGLNRLFSPSKWFNPYETEYFTVDVEYEDELERLVETEVEVVYRSALTDKTITPVIESLASARKKILHDAKIETKDLKNQFLDKIREVDNILAEKMNDLKEATKDEVAASKKLKEAQATLKLLQEVQDELNQILDI